MPPKSTKPTTSDDVTWLSVWPCPASCGKSFPLTVTRSHSAPKIPLLSETSEIPNVFRHPNSLSPSVRRVDGRGGIGGKNRFSTLWKPGFHGVAKRQNWVPWYGSFSETCFHAVEKPHNLGSMPWKIAEFDFHAVELFAPQGNIATELSRRTAAKQRRREGKTHAEAPQGGDLLSCFTIKKTPNRRSIFQPATFFAPQEIRGIFQLDKEFHPKARIGRFYSLC